MTRETVLSNARIVLEGQILDGTLVLRDGLIADISEGPSATGEDMEGDFLKVLIALHPVIAHHDSQGAKGPACFGPCLREVFTSLTFTGGLNAFQAQRLPLPGTVQADAVIGEPVMYFCGPG